MSFASATTKALIWGVHTPLISTQLFDTVQRVLGGKVVPKARTHDFLFRRLTRCAACSRNLVGETTKGFVYYRCHTRSCVRVCVREDRVWAAIDLAYAGATNFTRDELAEIEDALNTMHSRELASNEDYMRGLQLKTTQLKRRLDALTDALVDGLLDKDTQERRPTPGYESSSSITANLQ